jgi:endonuclease YncB( thermonuclease family)
MGCEKMPQPDSKKKNYLEKIPKIQITKILRADLFRILINGETQTVHLAGIKAPSPKPGRYNNNISKFTGQNIDLINKAGKQGIALTKELTKDRELRFVHFGTNTVKNKNITIDGDLIFQNGTTLTEKLLSYGAAVAPYDKYQTAIDYKQIAEDARKNERGIWRHPVKIEHRFHVNSSFKSETLSVDRSQIRQQGNGRNQRLESHKEFEKQGEILVKIQTRKPLNHPYKLTLTYAFVKRQDYGKKIQEVSSAPIRGEQRDSRNSSSKNRYKPLSSSDKELNRRISQNNKDYNRGVSGQNVFKLEASKSITEEIELNSLSTNIIILSDIVNYTKSTKAGTSYSHGEYYVNYDLEIRVGTNLIYSHYH